FEGRTQLVEELQRKGHIDRIEKYRLAAGTCYRCHSIVEPYLSEQWFVRMDQLAQPAVEAVKTGKLRFHPEYWSKTYLHWMENIRDWCISRQLWWGHRIPIWYAEDGTVFVSAERPRKEDLPAGCDPEALVQDEDVLDTWFSSWLWPFSTMGWPERTAELEKFYPTKVLSTASEIIFLWVARMVMAGYEFAGELPFSDVYIHGTVRDANGIKMSKSLGNGIDPVEIIEKYGADALRVSLTLATPDGQDPWISKNTFEVGRNFVNKLHQVSRFVMMRLEGRPPVRDTIDESDLVLFDRWILSRLERTIRAVDRNFAEYRLSAATKTLYNFVWNDYCSWYIELIKPDQPGQAIRPGSLDVATYVLDKIVKLLHPFAPFVTERIYLDLIGADLEAVDRKTTIVFGPWPTTQGRFIDDQLESSLEQIQAVVNAVRSVRSELNVPPGRKSDLYVRVDNPQFGDLLQKHIEYFRSLARVENLHCGTAVKRPSPSATAVITGAEIFVPLEGLIDLEVERNRVERELQNLALQLEKVSKKLANQDFLAHAPAEVIEREKAKKADFQDRIEKLNKNLEQIMGW
ncbi:MAG TPA: class I tRNA ligase family protein, partial [candidate division Zixibacteria bacterium]|nr:class I tRNA ligase family protein [candidate division Zixibacteria bacterium]